MNRSDKIWKRCVESEIGDYWLRSESDSDLRTGVVLSDVEEDKHFVSLDLVEDPNDIDFIHTCFVI